VDEEGGQNRRTLSEYESCRLPAVGLRNETDLEAAFKRIGKASPVKDVDYLVQEMIKGGRELVIRMVRDSQFA
jgi:carbamoylphosphate synthase large subunit